VGTLQKNRLHEACLASAVGVSRLRKPGRGLSGKGGSRDRTAGVPRITKSPRKKGRDDLRENVISTVTSTLPVVGRENPMTKKRVLRDLNRGGPRRQSHFGIGVNSSIGDRRKLAKNHSLHQEQNGGKSERGTTGKGGEGKRKKKEIIEHADIFSALIWGRTGRSSERVYEKSRKGEGGAWGPNGLTNHKGNGKVLTLEEQFSRTGQNFERLENN